MIFLVVTARYCWNECHQKSMNIKRNVCVKELFQKNNISRLKAIVEDVQHKFTILKARSWRVVKAKVHKPITWFSEVCLTSLIALF